jgi:hypothetical protein
MVVSTRNTMTYCIRFRLITQMNPGTILQSVTSDKQRHTRIIPQRSPPMPDKDDKTEPVLTTPYDYFEERCPLEYDEIDPSDEPDNREVTEL